MSLDLINPFAGLSPLALGVMALGLFFAALARGYSGFGFSAVLVSSWSLVTDPARAIAVALMLEVSDDRTILDERMERESHESQQHKQAKQAIITEPLTCVSSLTHDDLLL